MTLSTAASGAGTTGTFVFLVNSTPPVDMMPPSYPFPSYTYRQKVSVVINNIKTDVAYIFMVSAGNQYGTSDYVEASWIGSGEGGGDVYVNMCCVHYNFLQYTATTQPYLCVCVCVCVCVCACVCVCVYLGMVRVWGWTCVFVYHYALITAIIAPSSTITTGDVRAYEYEYE